MTRPAQDDRPAPDELRQTAVAYCAEVHVRTPEATPAGRLAAAGPAALTDNEVLELLLEPSCASQRPQNIEASLARLGGLGRLSWANSSDLRAEFGRVGADRLQLALDLAARIAYRKFAQRPIVDRPELVVDYLRLRYGDLDQEVLGVLYLNSHHVLIHERELYRGTLTRITAEPRNIFKEALLHSAAALILFHTHPDTPAAPSREDLEFTRKLKRAGHLLGISVEDHLILGADSHWVSLKRRGAC